MEEYGRPGKRPALPSVASRVKITLQHLSLTVRWDAVSPEATSPTVWAQGGANLIKPVRSTPPSQLHTKYSDFTTILTSLHLISDGFELKWCYCCTLYLLLCHTIMEHGHRATIFHSVSVIRCHRAGRAAPSLCGYCKVWRESHPSIACPHSVTVTTVGGTHAHISTHHLLHTVLKKMLHPHLLPLINLSFSFCEYPQQLHRDEEQEAFQPCDRSPYS